MDKLIVWAVRNRDESDVSDVLKEVASGGFCCWIDNGLDVKSVLHNEDR